MDKNIRKTTINGKMYDVVELDEYMKSRDLYSSNCTAIHIDEYALPITHQKNNIGIVLGDICYWKFPDPNDKGDYSYDRVIDFSNVTNIREMIQVQDAVRELETEILTAPDNPTKFRINPGDMPEMVAMKTAFNLKNVDIDKYEHRFGNNFNNDKRLFNKDRLSLPKVKRLCDKLDMKATLIIQDASPDVPNPMGEIVTIDLTGIEEEDDS